MKHGTIETVLVLTVFSNAATLLGFPPSFLHRNRTVSGVLAILLFLVCVPCVQAQQAGQHIVDAPVGEAEAVLYRSTATMTPVFNRGNTHDSKENQNAAFKFTVGRIKQLPLPGLDERRLGTLQTAISAADLTIPLTSVTGLRVGESLEIGRIGRFHNGELMRIASIDTLNNNITVVERFDAIGARFAAPQAWPAGTVVDHHRRARPENLPGYMVESGQSPTIVNFRLSWQGTDVPYPSLNLHFPGGDSQLKNWEQLLIYMRLRRADGTGTAIEGILPLAADAIVGQSQVLGNPYTIREQHLRRYLGWPQNLDYGGQGARFVSYVDDATRAEKFVGGPEWTFLQNMINWIYADDGHDLGRLYVEARRHNAAEWEALRANPPTASEDVVRSYQVVVDVALLNGADTRIDAEQFWIRTSETADPDGTRHTATDLGELSNIEELTTLSGTVNRDSDDKDYYGFTLSVQHNMRFELTGLSANANLYLENAKGGVLHRSISTSTSDDSITAMLAAGTYYIRVDAAESGTIDYQLGYRRIDDVSEAPTASFASMPETHNGNAFTFELHISEEVSIGYATVRDSVLSVSGGTVTSVRRLNPPGNQSWEITVNPSSRADVSISLSPTTDCSATGAICASDGKAQSSSLSATVTSAPLTARFESMPETHNGSAFTFELHISEEVSIGYATVRDSVLSVSGGTVTSVRRLNPPGNQSWEITVNPSSSNASVSIALSPTTDCSATGAICTSDGQKQSSSLSATVTGAAPKSVAPDLTFGLGANYPNPFNPETQIAYTLSEAGPVELVIYSILGQRVRTLVQEIQAEGRYQIVWNGRNDSGVSVASGVYLSRLSSAQEVQVRRLLLLK